MEKTIPVPAESIRQVAIDATEEIGEQREANRKNLASSIERDIGTVLSETAGKDGEFVSLSASTVSNLMAFSENFTHHADATRHYLEQYKIWK